MAKKKAKRAKKAAPRKKTAARKKTTAKRKSGLTQMTYTVSSALEAIVGAKKLTRPQIVKKLWAYIKAKKCQDTKNKRLIVPDDKLATVLGRRPVDMLKLAGLLSKHISK